MKKKELRTLVGQMLSFYLEGNKDSFWQLYKEQILDQKISFPYLEFVADQFYEKIGATQALNLAEESVDYGKVGGYVIAGKMLQNHLDKDIDYCFEKAIEYIIKGNEWFHCDIIGERVFGEALLLNYDKTMSLLKRLTNHEHPLIKRSVGVAIHYAVKKGIGKEKIEEMLNLLLSQATEKNLHVKKGCGWGIETIAKFHPELIKQFEEKIIDDPNVNTWIKRKYRLGLEKAEKIAKKRKKKVQKNS